MRARSFESNKTRGLRQKYTMPHSKISTSSINDRCFSWQQHKLVYSSPFKSTRCRKIQSQMSDTQLYCTSCVQSSHRWWWHCALMSSRVRKYTHITWISKQHRGETRSFFSKFSQILYIRSYLWGAAEMLDYCWTSISDTVSLLIVMWF